MDDSSDIVQGHVEKPMTMVREEFISDLANVINNAALPPFVVESILKDVYLAVKDVAAQRCQYEKEQYEKDLTSRNKQECEDIEI